MDGARLKASKKAFQHLAVVESVKGANRNAAERFETIYQRTIDFVGHPNERSVTANIEVTEEPDRRQMFAILLHGDGVQLDMSLKFARPLRPIASARPISAHDR